MSVTEATFIVATLVEVNLVSLHYLQKIKALFDLSESYFKLHFGGLKCPVSVFAAK